MQGLRIDCVLAGAGLPHTLSQHAFACHSFTPLPKPFPLQGLRIDYVLASPGLLDKVVSCEVLSAELLPPKWSDHAGEDLVL